MLASLGCGEHKFASMPLFFQVSTTLFCIPTDEAQWPNKEELEPYVWHIGNLTLLEPALNRDVGNADFKTKKEIYSKSQITITNEITSFAQWDPAAVKKRALNLVKIVEQVWRIP